jgi:hypothetical protein
VRDGAAAHEVPPPSGTRRSPCRGRPWRARMRATKSGEAAAPPRRGGRRCSRSRVGDHHRRAQPPAGQLLEHLQDQRPLRAVPLTSGPGWASCGRSVGTARAPWSRRTEEAENERPRPPMWKAPGLRCGRRGPSSRGTRRVRLSRIEVAAASERPRGRARGRRWRPWSSGPHPSANRSRTMRPPGTPGSRERPPGREVVPGLVEVEVAVPRPHRP